jgi:Uma2 family endonuclease
MNVQPNLHMDKSAFLAWVQGREERYELAEGRVMMMTGSTMAHGLIVRNVFAMLDYRLSRKTWSVLTEFGVDVGPRTIRYPDVVVDHRGARPKDRTVKAPAFVVEVLSPSTTTIDLGDKAGEYLGLSSVVAYLVLSQDEIKGWLYLRGITTGPEVIGGEEKSISVPALGIDLPLSEVYADVEFE